MPGFTQYNARVRQPGGFYLPNAPHQGKFKTPSQTREIHRPPHSASTTWPTGKLLLTTIRSHDQFNTTIYSENDRYRGISHGRRVIFLNDDDMRRAGLARRINGSISSATSKRRRAGPSASRSLPYDIPRGCAAAYFPETNVLVPMRKRRGQEQSAGVEIDRDQLGRVAGGTIEARDCHLWLIYVPRKSTMSRDPRSSQHRDEIGLPQHELGLLRGEMG